ncbi:lecithin retinol acyltransferase family protein [Solibacillus sp. Sa1YVA6]|uniref:Lecithin retinol acyltransferase family protein n=1 Tax=Solibacillus merdavium TaxID=2762218 RepID=A0ABR8XLU2_9BACL|nr:lecithin retinol acyltransferase family protein [Solibacillus merdavium]
MRARSRIGEMDYNLAMNNCENFVRWCRIGR